MRFSLATVRAWRLIALTALGVPVGILGAVTLAVCVGAPVFVFASGVLGDRPDIAAAAAAIGVVGLPAALGVAALDRELSRHLVDRATAAAWRRRPWTWPRLARLVIDETTWRRLLWLLLRALIGFPTVLVGWGVLAGIWSLLSAPFQRLNPTTLLGPLAAVALAYGLLQAARGTGWLLQQLAGELLGPSSRERIDRLEERTVDLEERARLARELHDSVGHSVTVVVLQAAAARKVLHRDPAFAEEALGAIEEAGRRTVGELADVLRLLRAEPGNRQLDAPGLERLSVLLDSTRAAGLSVRLRTDGNLAAVPAPVSHVAYRVVQEACTNVLRHVGRVATDVDLRIDGECLEVSVHNRAGRSAPAEVRGSGLGLAGLRERVGHLGGALHAGPAGAGYRVHASIPLGDDS
jgi:signal transduction histidine kinase